ncbi:TRAF3-interacting protein 1 isoform X4 [Nerophis lumbriciformis]|uniref:TRAF3-interacting protein 1 isoform X4 n=1 Tax=Nerophis lumbriciformis TaxID=546530 RepID=UPI002ADF9948|nr:TRAF3-interacting protein 1-like isoform X4 [Nerophis lumbriciformis]
MNAAVVKKTQDTLGKVIKKPPLTEKLLSKPPFRYLHDIFSEIIKTTGFMRELYKESELKSDNVKDKESKMAFLQKAIDVVALVSGEPLAAKPARIVAGHEPEKTNELLQAIAKCCLNKMSSEEAVKRVLSGETVDLKTKASTSKSQDKENRARREQQSSEREGKKKIERSRSREDKDSDKPPEQERQLKDGEQDHRHKKERSGKNHHREQDHTKDAEKDKSRDRGQDKGRGKDQEQDLDLRREKEKSRDRERIRERDSQRDHEKNKEKLRGRDKDIERRKEGEDKTRSKDRHHANSKDRLSELQPKNVDDDPRKTVTADPVPADESESPARIPRPSSAKGQRRKPRIDGRDESDSEADTDTKVAQGPVPKESGKAGSSFSSEMASSSKRMARPSSARPAPPPVKKQDGLTEAVPAERVPSAKLSVIRDGKKQSDDEEEDEQFLVAEAAPEPDKELGPARDPNVEEKHGGLVKKILDTKKDYESIPSSKKSKEKSVSEEERKKEQDLVAREIERLRASIQSVCQSALPLGKIMDYVQEDIDAMQAELQSWRKENKEHAQALQQEQRATDRALEPLQAELNELDQMIKDYQDKICTVRSNILRNEEKIQKKLAGIISS